MHLNSPPLLFLVIPLLPLKHFLSGGPVTYVMINYKFIR